MVGNHQKSAEMNTEYVILSPRPTVHTAAAMSFSRAKRFGDIRAAGPGPGRYEVRRLFDAAQPHPKPNVKKAGKLQVLLGKLHHARPQAVAKMGTNVPVATAACRSSLLKL